MKGQDFFRGKNSLENKHVARCELDTLLKFSKSSYENIFYAREFYTRELKRLGFKDGEQYKLLDKQIDSAAKSIKAVFPEIAPTSYMALPLPKDIYIDALEKLNMGDNKIFKKIMRQLLEVTGDTEVDTIGDILGMDRGIISPLLEELQGEGFIKIDNNLISVVKDADR